MLAGDLESGQDRVLFMERFLIIAEEEKKRKMSPIL
jgi:hypothetical protein